MRLWPVASGVAWRTLKNVLTTPSLLLPSLVFPLFFFVAFAGGLSQVQNTPGFDYPNGYTAFQFVFVLLQSAAFGGVFTGFGVARDFEGGFARRLLLAAPNRNGIVARLRLAAMLRWCITATLLTTIALLVGMQVGGGPVDLVGIYTLALIINVCGFLWAAGIAMRLRRSQAGPLMQMPVFLLLFLAPVYVPLALLGDTITRPRGSTRHVRARGGSRASSPATRPTWRSGSGCRCLSRSLHGVGAPRPAVGRAGRLGPRVRRVRVPRCDPGPESRFRSARRRTAAVRTSRSTSENAERVELCLFDEDDVETASSSPGRRRHNWHGYLPGVGPGPALRLPRLRPLGAGAGTPVQPDKLLIDPYAKAIEGPVLWDRGARSPTPTATTSSSATRATMPPRSRSRS